MVIQLGDGDFHGAKFRFFWDKMHRSEFTFWNNGI